MNIDALSGRELDTAVAKRLFGYAIAERVNPKTGKPDAVYRLPSGDWARVPSYAARITASIQVEVRLEDLGWKRLPAPKVTGPQEVVLVGKDGRSVKAKGESLGEALARAALKAVMP